MGNQDRRREWGATVTAVATAVSTAVPVSTMSAERRRRSKRSKRNGSGWSGRYRGDRANTRLLTASSRLQSLTLSQARRADTLVGHHDDCEQPKKLTNFLVRARFSMSRVLRN